MGSRELFGIACASSLTINRWHFKVLMFIYLEVKIMLTGLVSSNHMWVAFNSIWSEFLATTT